MIATRTTRCLAMLPCLDPSRGPRLMVVWLAFNSVLWCFHAISQKRTQANVSHSQKTFSLVSSEDLRWEFTLMKVTTAFIRVHVFDYYEVSDLARVYFSTSVCSSWYRLSTSDTPALWSPFMFFSHWMFISITHSLQLCFLPIASCRTNLAWQSSACRWR